MSGPEEHPAPGEQDPDAPPGMRRVDRPGPTEEGGGDPADDGGDAGLPPGGEEPMEGAAPSG